MMPYFSDNDRFTNALKNLGIYQKINWKVYSEIKNDRRQVKRFIQREISCAVKQSAGAKYMTLFFIKPTGNKGWGYWLIHLTNAYRAHDVMKSLHWRNANFFRHELEHGIFEFGYEVDKDTELVGNSGLLDFEFDDLSEESCIKALHEDFGKLIFQKEHVEVKELFENTVSMTPASESQLQASIRSLHQEKEVVVKSKDGKHRQINKKYKPTDIIIPSKQLKLFI